MAGHGSDVTAGSGGRRPAFAVAGVAIAAAAAAVSVALVTSSSGDRGAIRPTTRVVPSWALPWPAHHNASVTREQLAGAVEAWQRYGNATGHRLPPPAYVVWYVAQRAFAANDILVVFEVDGETGHRLVAGYADAQLLEQLDSKFTHDARLWRLFDVPAPPPDYRGIIGVNMVQGGGWRSHRNNIIAVLARPTARTVRWTAPGVPSGTVATDHGLAIVDLGKPTGKPAVSVSYGGSGDSVVADSVVVGVPGSPASQLPALAPPPRLGPGRLTGATGQGTQGYATVARGYLDGPSRIFARCYGGTVMRVSIDTNRIRSGVAIPCDSREHQVRGPVLVVLEHARPHWVRVVTDESTAWRVAVTLG